MPRLWMIHGRSPNETLVPHTARHDKPDLSGPALEMGRGRKWRARDRDARSGSTLKAHTQARTYGHGLLDVLPGRALQPNMGARRWKGALLLPSDPASAREHMGDLPIRDFGSFAPKQAPRARIWTSVELALTSVRTPTSRAANVKIGFLTEIGAGTDVRGNRSPTRRVRTPAAS